MAAHVGFPIRAGRATDGVIQYFPTKSPGRTHLTRVVLYHSNIHRHKVNEGKHGGERTTDDQYTTPEHGRHRHRRAFEPNPIHSVVVRQWHGRDDGPGRYPVFLTYDVCPGHRVSPAVCAGGEGRRARRLATLAALALGA